MAYNPLLQGITFSQQAAQQYQQAQNQTQGMNLGQLSQSAAQQFNQAYNQYAQQGMSQAISAQQYANLLNSQQPQRQMWMWTGVAMDVIDFAKHAYGDTPEATHFILKYKEIA